MRAGIVTSIVLDDSLHELLYRESRKQKTSRSKLVRTAISDFFARNKVATSK